MAHVLQEDVLHKPCILDCFFFFFFSLRDQLPSSLPLRKRLNKPKLCPHHLWVHYSCVTAHFVLHFVSLSGMLMVKQSLVIHVLQICHLPMSKYLFLHFLKIYFSIILSKTFDFFKCQLLLLYLICFFFLTWRWCPTLIWYCQQ